MCLHYAQLVLCLMGQFRLLYRAKVTFAFQCCSTFVHGTHERKVDSKLIGGSPKANIADVQNPLLSSLQKYLFLKIDCNKALRNATN